MQARAQKCKAGERQASAERGRQMRVMGMPWRGRHRCLISQQRLPSSGLKDGQGSVMKGRASLSKAMRNCLRVYVLGGTRSPLWIKA